KPRWRRFIPAPILRARGYKRAKGIKDGAGIYKKQWHGLHAMERRRNKKFIPLAARHLQETIPMSHAHFAFRRQPSRPATAGKSIDKRGVGVPNNSCKIKKGISGGI